MNTWKNYGWHIDDIHVTPLCSMGPFTVKARSTREAARKFWKRFRADAFSQVAGPPRWRTT